MLKSSVFSTFFCHFWLQWQGIPLWLESESSHPCKRAQFGPHWHGRLFKGKGIPPLHTHTHTHTHSHHATRNPPSPMTSDPRAGKDIRPNVPPLSAPMTTLIYMWAHAGSQDAIGSSMSWCDTAVFGVPRISLEEKKKKRQTLANKSWAGSNIPLDRGHY